jgi:inosine-uridine nucleoside N-ribohydrolase
MPAFKRLFCAALLAGALNPPGMARAQTPQFVIEDNDYDGPGGSNVQSVIPLLAAPNVQVLGFTVSTGDGWENANSAHLRRFLEIAHRTDVPVHDGAVYPLMNTVAAMKMHEQQFGPLPWKGAWGGAGSIETASPTQPPLKPLREGDPKLAAQSEEAALFLIRTVHRHPHQVTIFEAGAMTNLALAIRLDPTFASTAKQLVFMGGLIDTNMSAINGNAAYTDDFNLVFDPEAAHITLTADWPKITVVGNISAKLMLSRADLAALQDHPSPVTRYMQTYYDPMPLWDEMAAAIVVDPALITKSQTVYMDVETRPGIDYGRAHVWTRAQAPVNMGVRPVDLVEQVNEPAFLTRFRKDAQNLGTTTP